VFAGSSPITFTSLSSKASPEVRVLCSAGVTRSRRSYDPVRLPPWPSPVAMLRPLPSPTTGLPRLPEPPFRRAVPTTPADRAGAHVDCFPARLSLPPLAGGSASALSLSRPAQALLALRPAGSLSRPRRPLSRGSDPASCPAEPLASFRIQSTIIRVEPSSTDDSRLRGALPEPDSGSAANNVRGILCSDAASGSPPGTDSLSPRAPAACGRVAASGGG